jgi:ABC-2 type transport system permease protein
VSEGIRDTLLFARRVLRNLMRQPWFVIATLTQPVVLLLLSSALFSKVATLPGFGWESYLTFLAPGLVVMGALFAGGWNGMGVVGDIDRGVMDRLLVTPMRRGALVGGKLTQLAVLVVVQSVILMALAEIRGATFENGAPGMLALLVAAVLIAAPVGALSTAIALTTRTVESLIAGVAMVLLPLTYLTSLFMPAALAPHWIQTVAPYNPVDWAVTAARMAVSADPDWGAVFVRFGYLTALTAVCVAFAVRAFRSYVRSV